MKKTFLRMLAVVMCMCVMLLPSVQSLGIATHIYSAAASTAAVKVTKQPASVTAGKGKTAKVSFTAKGDGLKYVWYYKDSGMSSYKKTTSFKGNTYSVKMDVAKNGRQVYCKVTDKYGNTVKTKTVKLSMKGAATITKQPASVTVVKGKTAKVSFTAKGDGLKYVWYYKDSGKSSYKKTTSFKSNTYSVKMDDAKNGRQVYCKVTDKYGNTVKTKTVKLSMKVVASVTKQPASVSVDKNKTAKVSFAAKGDGLKYVWYYKDSGMSSFKKTTSFKSNTYSVKMDDAKNGRQVYCKVTDKYGNTVKTKTVKLSIKVAASITKQPVSVTADCGTNAKVTLTAKGDGLTYKWYYKNPGKSKFTLASSATGNSYSVKMSETYNGTQVYCVVADEYGKSVTSSTVTLKAKHSYDAGTVTTKPTCTKDGVKVFTCKGCSNKITEAVAKTGHDMKMTIKQVDATCTADGKTAVYTCANGCGHKTGGAVIPATEHSYTSVVTAPTCTSDGYTTYTCACGETYTADKTEATGHVLTTVEVKAPTCTETGYEAYEYCSVCDYTTYEEIAANGHSLTAVEAKAPTCTEVGYEAYEYCSACDFTTYEEIAATGHSLTAVEAKAPTCTEIGYEAYEYCSACDYTTYEEIEATGHSLTAVEAKAPTCTEVGYEAYEYCSACDYTTYEEISATGHSMGAWKEIIEATVTSEGLERSECSNCEYYEENTLAKLEVKYEITVNTGVDEPVIVGVAENGKYALVEPAKIGYNFMGWETAEGDEFASSGVYTGDIEIFAVWELDGTDTIEELAERTAAGVDIIEITADITVNQPLYISGETTVYADADFTLMRDSAYEGIIFVVGKNSEGEAVEAVLNIGGGEGTLTVDGNAENVTADVTGSVIHVYDGGVVNVCGTAIKNNKAFCGGAIYLAAGSTANISDSTLSGNSSSYGGAVYAAGGNATLTNVTATGNTSSKGGAINVEGGVHSITGSTLNENTATSGGAICVNGSSTQLTISDTIVDNNTAGNGGAVYLYNGCKLTVNGGSISENGVGTGSGGAIVGYSSTLEINGAVLNSNTAGYGGAISLNGGTADISDTEFNSNSSTVRSGAIDVTANSSDYGRLNMTGGKFEGNESPDGGAVSVRTSSTVSFDGTTFKANKSTTPATNDKDWIGGGAISVIKGTANISGATFTDNVSPKFGGAILVSEGVATISNNTVITSTLETAGTDTGSAIYFYQSVGSKISDSIISGNKASSGAAIDIKGSKSDITIENCTASSNSTAGGNAGAINLLGGKLTLKGGVFSGNSGSYGGAIYANPATLNIEGTKFLNNSAAVGAAISINGTTVTVNDSANNVAEFSKNTASNRGGAIDVNSSGSTKGTLTMNGGKFDGNTSSVRGGAVNVQSGNTASFDGTTFSNNKITDANTANDKTVGGGAILVRTGSLTVKNATFDNNDVTNYGAAVMLNASTLEMSNTTIKNCDSTSGTGAAIYLYNCTSATVTDTQLINNSARWNGVVYTNAGTLKLENITATGNSANNGAVFYFGGGTTNVIGGSFTGNTATTNGGVIYANAGTINVSGGTYSENTAAYGGAICLEAASATSAANLTINKDADGVSTVFDNNTSTVNGGAIYIADSTAEGTAATTLTMNDAVLSNNKAKGMGGALSTDGTSTGLVIKVNNCTFDNNQSGYEAAASSSAGGGAVEIQNGNAYSNGDPTEHKIAFTNCVFENNKGNGTGGVFDIRSASYVYIDGIEARDNSSIAEWNGAVIYVTSEGSRLYLKGDVTAENNTAGGKDTFAYVNNAKAWVYTTHSSTAPWVGLSSSLSAINFDQTI